MADLISLIGFAITVWVLLETRSLKKTFLAKARTPEIKQSFEKARKSLQSNLGSGKWPEQRHLVFEDLIKIRSGISNAIQMLPSDKSTRLLHNKLKGKRVILLKRLTITTFNLDETWEVHAELSGVIAYLEQLERNLRWK